MAAKPPELINRDFAAVLYRALRMIVVWLEKTYGFGSHARNDEEGP